MKESATYHIIEREEWMEFYQNSVAPLTKEELEQLKGLNDQISLRDVEDVDIPIAHLFDIYLTQYDTSESKNSVNDFVKWFLITAISTYL